MKPYDKSNSFMRRVTKRVSEFIPGTSWVNMLLGESQSSDDPASICENDDQPPVKKLCTSNNSFTTTNYRPCVDTNLPINAVDNHNNSHVLLPEISAVTCVPSTSRQSPKFTNQLNASLQVHDIGSRGSLKRKSDVADLSNVNRQTPKTIGFNFASSTPTLVTTNKQQVATSSLIRSSNSNRLSTNNEFLTPTSSKLIKSRDESQSSKFRETTSNHLSSASFRWDTFVNYGELSERQKLFAQKSPLNCSQVMYGGNSARSNLSKILGNTPPIHRKAVIPISPTNNSEIRTTSSILLGHISTKDKEIEENKFIIQPKVHQRHKAEQKNVPLVVETTMKLVETIPEKTDEKSIDVISTSCSGRDASRKLRANISKKSRGLKFDEHEMPAKVDLPNITLPMPVLPNIKLSSSVADDNEFKFNQPLTLEQFSLQIAEKTSRKKQKMSLRKTQSPDNKYSSNFTNLNQSCTLSVNDTLKTVNDKVSIANDDIRTENVNKNDKVSEICKFDDDSSKDNSKNSIQDSNSKIESTKNPSNIVCENSSLQIESSDKTLQICETSNFDNSQKPSTILQPSSWTSESSAVINKNEADKIVECSKPPEPVKKLVEPSKDWTCDACWVKNKSDCTSCISCGTVKPGCVAENKLQSSTQFKFGLNNNAFEQSTSGSQFKFGFSLDSNKTEQSSSQFKFGSATLFQTPENGKTDASVSEFKFGSVNNKTDLPLSTFKFGIDNTISQPTKKPGEVPNNINTDKSESQFKFGFEKKADQPESQFKFGQSASNNKPLAQFKFGFDNVDADKSVQQNVASDNNKIAQSVNELKSLVNNKNEISEKSAESPIKSVQFKFGGNPMPQVTFGSVETNSNNIGLKNDESSKGKCVWDKKDKVEVKTISPGMSPTVQSMESTKSTQLVNGHSHSNETLNEDQKPGFKVPQLFSFSSLAAKQDQNLPDDQKKSKTFTFGSATNDTKSFVAPALASGSFPNTNTVFGANNSMFSSGSTSSSATALGSSKPQFSFGSIAPATNSLFSVKDNDKKPSAQTSSSFTSSTNVGFSFGAQSPPAFSVANASGFMKSSIQVDDQIKNTPNVLFNQPSTKTVKLDPNAPISINFTGGATTQFTAKPETSEPPPKRKILKPVRRIR